MTVRMTVRADDGNRTRMTSLEGWSSTIELHPRDGRPGRPPSQVAYRLAPRSRTRSAPATPRGGRDDAERVRGAPSRHVVSARLSGAATQMTGQSHVRQSDIHPYSRPRSAPAPFQCAATRRHQVVSRLSIAATGCYVRLADIVAKSQLGMAPSLALDTYLRNGHASDQAQLTVLRTLVRCIDIPGRGRVPTQSGGPNDGITARSRRGADGDRELTP